MSPDFTAKTKRILSDRAAGTCSNPDCKIPTKGPHTIEDKYINIGEACHIKGARSNAKRYDSKMSNEERSSITNGIRLCEKCGKLIDTDEERYSVEILYKWRIQHETSILQKMEGKKTDFFIRENIIEILNEESLKAQQIGIDKDKHWEYMLTVELLENKLKKVNQAYKDLHRGLNYRQTIGLPDQDFEGWFTSRIDDLSNLLEMLTTIITNDLMESFGPKGKPGSTENILYSCNKIYEAAQGFVEWEKEIKFTNFPKELNEAKMLMQGWSKNYLSEINKISSEIKRIIEHATSGTYKIELLFEAPTTLNTVVERLKAYFN